MTPTDRHADIRISDRVFRFSVRESDLIESDYGPFVCGCAGQADAAYRITRQQLSFSHAHSSCDWSGPTWRFWTTPTGHAVEVFVHGARKWVCTALVDDEFQSGDIRPWNILKGRDDSRFPQYPTDRIVITNRLARLDAIALHASAIRIDGTVYLFCGRSGIGKSTIAELLCAHSGAALLNDDRAIIFLKDNGPWAVAAPWHGKNPQVDPQPGPLGGVFHLEQSAKNRLELCGPGLATAKLLATGVIPFYNAPGTERATRAATTISLTVPSYQLAFKPTAEVGDLLSRRAFAKHEAPLSLPV